MHKFAGLRVADIVRVADILRTKKTSIRFAPLPIGSLTWVEFELMLWEQIEDGARRNEPGFKMVRKLLTDQRFDR